MFSMLKGMECLHDVDSETNHCCQKKVEHRNFAISRESTALKDFFFLIKI